MKATKSQLITAFLVLAVSCMIFAGVLCWIDRSYKPPPPPGEKASVGTDDDPRARERYEWMRLHDPATGEIPAGIRRKELQFASALPTKESLELSALRKPGNAAQVQLSTWTPRGPNNVGGRTRALAVDLDNANVLLAGGASGGMWILPDTATTWIKTTSPTQLPSVTCIVQDPRPGKHSTWYYGTGEYNGQTAAAFGAPYQGDGIFKSTNGGNSWTLLSSTSHSSPQVWNWAFDYIFNIVVNPANLTNDEVYAAVPRGIKRSTDGGATWGLPSEFAIGVLDNGFADIAVTTTGVFYAALSSNNAAGAGISRSTDGTTWTDITPGTGWPTTFDRIVIGIAPSNQNILYFLGITPGAGFFTNQGGDPQWTSFWKYTYLSGDGTGTGGSWEDRSMNLPAFGGPVGDFEAQGGYDLLVKVKPDNADVVFIGGTNLYRSTDGFATSTKTAWIGGYATSNDIKTYPGHHADQHAIAFPPGFPTAMYSGHDGGISLTTDNLADTVKWIRPINGYVTSQFYTVNIDHSTQGNEVIIGGLQDNGCWLGNSFYYGPYWALLGTGDGAFSGIAENRTSYYRSVQGAKIYREIRADNGAPILDGSGRWFARVDPTGGTGYLFINPFVLDPNETRIMFLAGGESLWRNSDPTAIPLYSGGTLTTTSVNWTNLTQAGIPGATISALGISTSAPARRLYYGSTNGKVFRLDNANTVDPTVASLDVWTGKGFPVDANVSCIAVDPTNGNKAMLVFSNYSVQSLFFTSDSGSSWTNVSGNLEQNPDGSGDGPSTRWAAILPVAGETNYFVGTSTGLYSTKSLNGSNTVWAQEGASTIGNVVVDMIDTRISDGLVVAATHGNGVFSSNLAVTSVNPGELAKEFSLSQNYPNPFNPTTAIRYQLSAVSQVSLQVFDILGRKVATLVNEKKSAGTYTIQFDASALASGIYLYTLQARQREGGQTATGDFVSTKKMIVLK